MMCIRHMAEATGKMKHTKETRASTTVDYPKKGTRRVSVRVGLVIDTAFGRATQTRDFVLFDGKVIV